MVLILSALYFFPATAAPVANLTALQTVIAPAWVADPAGRGTWSLLYSCLFTLLLCVYTAIHLNVPPPNDTKLTFWLRKTKWVAIAIFAPELVVYTAFEQWFLAKQFMKAINEAAAKSKVEKNKTLPLKNRDPPSKPPFDMVYAHYAIVGQAIERKVAGYPITLLEVHTIVHVVYVVVMYGLWIRKPLNVQDPTVIDFRDRLDILAFMLQTSSRAGHNVPGFECKNILGDKINRDPTFLWYTNSQPVSLEVKDTTNEVFSAADIRTVDDNRVLTKYDMKTDIPNIVEEFTPCHNSRDQGKKTIQDFPPQDRICAIFLSQADINRLELTAKFITRIELAKLDSPGYTPKTISIWDSAATASFYKQTSALAQFSNFPTPKQDAEEFLTLRAPNFYGSILSNIGRTSAYLATAIALIPTAYGCVHLGALSIIFPTPVERLLWKMSCYYLIATAGASALFSLIIYAYQLIYVVRQRRRTLPRQTQSQHRVRQRRSSFRPNQRLFMHRVTDKVADILVSDILVVVSVAVIGLILPLYVSARLYIVIESFISLRHVPIGVYQTPSLNIMGNVPHL
ncbi:uncharacterized protein PAC_12940 [Phialocephala subalpina]|uniref:Uncharacterized protein n=1 Tax=Phialocephala subalpina TaxID=576137 RepID=A0A1L7XDF1_9HELO|nr:uncharacterized protein PAC_12940 [Phialocephala subalpina]